MTAFSLTVLVMSGSSVASVPDLLMTEDESIAPESADKEQKSEQRPLDELLSKRSKPFSDWKEEREYLRRKWGPQGKQINPLDEAEEDPSAKEG
tara:strand:- start:304 stop:585 length:282 start_codon:yes stop_codon:yes gene_type:complete